MEYTIEQVGQAVDEMRKSIESGTLTEEKRAKLDIVLDAYETKNQELTKAAELIKTNEESINSFKEELEIKSTEAGEMRTRLEAFEIALAKSQKGSGVDDYTDTPEYKAFERYVIEGNENIDPEVKVALRTDAATEGGVLVTSEMESSILKQITEIDGLRSICRVRPTSSKSVVVPIRTGIPTAQYEGEAELGTDSTSAYGSETLTAFRQTHTVPITRDMLMDSSFDMQSEIMSDSAEAFAFGEGNGFVVGSGHKVPQGFTTDTRIQQLASVGAAGTLSPDDPILIQGQLKTGYDGTFVLNRRTLANLRTKKASDNSYLWQPGLNGPAASTLSGDPYILANSMPDIANDALCLAYGSFRIGYLIVDRTATEVIRDDYSLKKQAIVEFTIHRWNTGKVVLPEAIKLLKLNS